MKIFGLTGWSGSGKTTLMVKLIPELSSRRLVVSTIKHAHHSFDVDKPGKDSFEHRAAGAQEVLVSSSSRWALMHELRGEDEPTLSQLIEKMTPVDLLLIEGFKRETYPKMEIWREENGKPLRAGDDKNIVAVAAAGKLDDMSIPVLDLDDVPAIADFIIQYLGLEKSEY